MQHHHHWETDQSRWVHAGKQLSGAQRHVLTLISLHQYGLTARDLAKALWPDSPSWATPTARKRGGVVFGQGAQLKAGSMLEPLRRAALIRRDRRARWTVTTAGRNFLEAGKLDLDLDDEHLF